MNSEISADSKVIRNLQILLVIVAVFSRWIPHPWNFTAVGATALFAGATFKSRGLSAFFPLLVLILSDLYLGFHSTMIFVYGAFFLNVILGWFLNPKVRKNENAPWAIVGGATLFSSLVFFLVTNFGVWLTGELYPRTGEGLWACFVAALPFFKNQIFGDLFFSILLFACYSFAKKKVASSSRLGAI